MVLMFFYAENTLSSVRLLNFLSSILEKNIIIFLLSHQILINNILIIVSIFLKN